MVSWQRIIDSVSYRTKDYGSAGPRTPFLRLRQEVDEHLRIGSVYELCQGVGDLLSLGRAVDTAQFLKQRRNRGCAANPCNRFARNG